jgi:transmembrane sensor
MTKDSMNDFDPTAPMTEQASHWWVTLNTGPASTAEHRAFGEWVARSPERIEAFLQTAQLTKALKSKKLPWPDTPVEVLAREVKEGADIMQLREVSPRPPALSEGESNSQRRMRKPALLLASAASVLALVAGMWVWVNHADRYETAVGEQRSVVLRDGSLITLNTDSGVEVEFERNHRLIRLLSGEALFQVAKDSTRPFDVVVGDTTVRAIGTQFNIDKRALSTTVTVVEGTVAVAENPHSASSAQLRNPAPSQGEGAPQGRMRMTYLSAGQQLTVAARKPVQSVPQSVNLATATAWTQRRLVFDHRPLGEVAEEFNRYNAQAIQIESAQLRRQEVTGVFQANDPDSFLDFVANIPGVKFERNADSIQVIDSR